MRIGMTFSALR